MVAVVDVASDDDGVVAVAVLVEEVAVDAEAVQVAVPVAVEQAVVDGNDDYYLKCVAHWAKPNTNFLWEFYLNGRHLRILNFAVAAVHALSMYAFYREPQQPILVAVAVVAGYYSYFDS